MQTLPFIITDYKLLSETHLSTPVVNITVWNKTPNTSKTASVPNWIEMRFKMNAI